MRRTGYALFGIFVVGFMAAYFATVYGLLDQPARQAGINKPTEASKVKLVRTYAMSGETEVETWDGPRDFNHLKMLFPESDGWRYIWQPDGSLTLENNNPGLAPSDKDKRHLGVWEGHVAVILGPVGIDGGLDRIYGIRLTSLPPTIQEQLQKGALEYMTEEELLLLSENYDEE